MSTRTPFGSNVFSAYQLMARQVSSQRPALEYLDEQLFVDHGPRPKSVIEISGNTNVGKSLLLWQLMAKCLPPTYFGGKYCDVIFLNCSHKFSIEHFMKYVEGVITESGENCTASEKADVVSKCLESVTMLNCYSGDEFDLAFDMLDDILLKNSNIALVAIDSLDAFYWMDIEKKLLRMSTHYTRNLDKLKRLCNNHNVCCVFTANTNYVCPKALQTSLAATCSWSNSSKCQYALRLSLMRDGSRTLNERNISIDDFGIHLIK